MKHIGRISSKRNSHAHFILSASPFISSEHWFKLLVIVTPRWFEYRCLHTGSSSHPRCLPILNSLDLSTGAVIAIVETTLELRTWTRSNFLRSISRKQLVSSFIVLSISCCWIPPIIAIISLLVGAIAPWNAAISSCTCLVSSVSCCWMPPFVDAISFYIAAISSCSCLVLPASCCATLPRNLLRSTAPRIRRSQYRHQHYFGIHEPTEQILLLWKTSLVLRTRPSGPLNWVDLASSHS